MELIVKRAMNKLVDIISQWDEVECITQGTSVENDSFDPYFALAIEVYFNNSLRDKEKRDQSFGSPRIFETSASSFRDHFMLNELPVRIKYRQTERIEEILKALEGSLEFALENGTYLYACLTKDKVLFRRNNWLDKVRNQLNSLDGDFWEKIRLEARFKMERALSDFGAATMRTDDIFYLQSLASFVRGLCSYLFACNREFEPGLRYMSAHLMKLNKLPPDFDGRFRNLVKPQSSLSSEQRFEVARLLTQSVINL